MHAITLRRSAGAAGAGGSLAGSAAVSIRTVAAVLASTLVVGAVVLARNEPTTAVSGDAGTVWLSGEALGRVVLAAPRAQRPSVSVELVSGATEFDMADLDGSILVHDRLGGTVVVLDTASGTELTRFEGPVAPDDRPVLVDAGTDAFLIDVVGGRAQRIDAAGVASPWVDLGVTLSAWAGASNGILWILDAETNQVIEFDGTSTEPVGSQFQGDGLQLSVVGTEPVVFEPFSGRLRWPRRDATVAVPGAIAGDIDATVLVQQPAHVGSCAVVVTATAMSCVGTAEVERTTPLVGQPFAAGGTLAPGAESSVITWPGQPDVAIVSWTDGSVVRATRREPSQRRTVSERVTGSVIINDPGSPYAITVDGTDVIELDKFERRTVVLDPDGSRTDDGVGTADENADVAGAVPSAGAVVDARDDDGQNDPPEPQSDRAVTRVGRAVTIGVLENDVDPDGDPLMIAGVGELAVEDGDVTVIGGSSIRYDPPLESVNRTISFDYRATDPSNVEATALVTVDIIGDGSNTDPELVDDEAATRIGTPITISVLENDRDGEGDPLTITTASGAEHGTLAVASGATVRYEPEAGFEGVDRFEYSVDDGFGGVASAEVEVTVSAADTGNQAPIAEPDRVSVQAGVPTRFDPLANDRDPDGDRITLVRASSLSNVSIRVVGRSLEIVADQSIVGLLSFTYEIQDEAGLKDSARVALIVEQPSVDEPPVAVDDRASSPGTPVSIDVVANDIERSGGQLVVADFSQPLDRAGVVSQVSPTTLQFTPASGFTGPARFTYTIENAAGLTASAAVTVDVSGGSASGPVAVDDVVQIYPGQIATVRALANDSHPDGLALAYDGAPTTSSGVARVTPDRAISFDPQSDQLGTYTIGYRIRDTAGRKASAQITVQVVERPTTNLAPRATNDVRTISVGGSLEIDVLANDTDPEGEPLRVESVTSPNLGRAERVGNRVRYTAPRDGAGLATFSYRVVDEEGLSADGLVVVQVTAADPVAPVVADDLITLAAGESASVPVLANDRDPDGDSSLLSIVSVGSFRPSGGVSASVSGRSLRVTAGDEAGTFTASYTVGDADGLTASGTLTVSVTEPDNRPPVASPDSYSGVSAPFSVAVLANDSDPDGGALTLASVGNASPAGAGTASAQGSSVRFAPSPDFQGTVTIGYTVRDEQGLTANGVLTATLTACPAVPQLEPLTAETSGVTPVDISLFAAGKPAGTTVSVTQPAAGTAVLASSGASVRFTPAPGGAVAVIGYSVANSCGGSATSTIRVTTNTAPVATGFSVETRRNTAVTVDVVGNSSDVDGDSIVVSDVGDFVNGTADISAGQVRFTPTPGFRGVASFTYRVEDSAAKSNRATVTVEVGVAGEPPVALADVVTHEFVGAAFVITAFVLGNDSDPDGDPLTVKSITHPAPRRGVTIFVTPGGQSVTVQVPATFGSGTFPFQYVVTDGVHDVTGSVQIQIADRINLAPVANPDSGEIDLRTDSSKTFRVLDNDTDPDGDADDLELVRLENAPAGASIANGGRIRYTPPPGVTGQVQIVYIVADADGAESRGILTVSVVDTTPPPTTEPPPTTVPPPTTQPPPPPTDPPVVAALPPEEAP